MPQPPLPHPSNPSGLQQICNNQIIHQEPCLLYLAQPQLTQQTKPACVSLLAQHRTTLKNCRLLSGKASVRRRVMMITMSLSAAQLRVTAVEATCKRCKAAAHKRLWLRRHPPTVRRLARRPR